MSDPDWAAAVSNAAGRISGRVRRTPVVTVDDGLGLDYPVELKLELMQHTGSFKPRGAFNNLLSRDVPEAGVVAASGGNHGAAVAYAARRLGIPARIFVPQIAGPAKIALIRETGADLVITEGDYSGALAAAREHEAATGAVQVHAYDAPETVAGQGTLALEWEAQGLDADTVLAPDEAIAEAQARLWRGLRVLAEPGGATALAALVCGAYEPAPGERVAVLVCGGNPAPDPLAA